MGWEEGRLHAKVWENVKGDGGNREMIVCGDEQSGAEWVVCVSEIEIRL